MNLSRRLDDLERAMAAKPLGPCDACGRDGHRARPVVVYRDADDPAAPPLPPCPACGREALRSVVTYVPQEVM